MSVVKPDVELNGHATDSGEEEPEARGLAGSSEDDGLVSR